MMWNSVYIAIALALPYGVLADKIGRRPILMMSLASLMASEIWDRIVCEHIPYPTRNNTYAMPHDLCQSDTQAGSTYPFVCSGLAGSFKSQEAAN